MIIAKPTNKYCTGWTWRADPSSSRNTAMKAVARNIIAYFAARVTS